MTTPRRIELEKLPNWPRYLSRAQAAAYLGVSEPTFNAELDVGIWPPGVRRPIGKDNAGIITWDRALLDHFANQASHLAL